jgi:hypothetical protein
MPLYFGSTDLLNTSSMAALLTSQQNTYAPGSRVSIRGEEWLIRRIDRTSSDAAVLRVVGLSPLVEGKESRFIDSIERENEEISIVDPRKTKAVADSSSYFCESRLLLESHIRLRHGRYPSSNENSPFTYQDDIDPEESRLCRNQTR